MVIKAAVEMAGIPTVSQLYDRRLTWMVIKAASKGAGTAAIAAAIAADATTAAISGATKPHCRR